MATNAIVIDKAVLGYAGEGPEFRLADLAYEDYPVIYHTVEIRLAHWDLLADVAEGRDLVNLSAPVVDLLAKKAGNVLSKLEGLPRSSAA